MNNKAAGECFSLICNPCFTSQWANLPASKSLYFFHNGVGRYDYSPAPATGLHQNS